MQNEPPSFPLLPNPGNECRNPGICTHTDQELRPNNESAGSLGIMVPVLLELVEENAASDGEHR